MIYLLLGVAGVLFLIPVYILLVTSLTSFAEVNLATMWNLPSGLNLDSFRSATIASKRLGAGISCVAIGVNSCTSATRSSNHRHPMHGW